MTDAAAAVPAHAAGPALAEPWRLDRSLAAVLRNAAAGHPRAAFIAVDDDGREAVLPYPDLLDLATRMAGGLQTLGLAPGEKVLFQTARVDSTIPLMWACFLSGLVAVPTAPVALLDEASAPLRKLRGVWEMLGRPLVVAERRAADALAAHGAAHGWTSLRVAAVEDLAAAPPAAGLPEVAPDALAMLPLTSGSTGLPKAVMLTHRNILAMAAGTNQANGFHAGDVALNWMPLDHPGALVFLGVVPMDVGATQIHVPTNYVLSDPLRWLDLISRHRSTISWAPNFAFALVNTRLSATDRRYDLSSMRFLVSAGEQVAAATARTFLELMESHGLPSGALRPAFGMAETCSGITWSPGLTTAMLAENPTWVSLGPAIPGAELRITDESDAVLPEGETGILQLRGPSVLGGYYDNPVTNAAVMRGEGWFATGDLAFIRGGELHITGRSTEVVIVNGLNVAAHDLEAAAEEVEGVAVSYAAAFAVWSEARATEDLVIVFSPETADPGDATACADIVRRLRSHVTRQMGIAPVHVVPLPPAEIPKTSIGKIQRAALKRRFQAGAFDTIIAALAAVAPALPAGAGRAAAAAAAPAARRAPNLALEAEILAVWQGVLGLDTIDPDASFFELGGHSVLLIQVHGQIKERFPALDLVDLFKYPTIRTLAAFLSGPDAAAASAPAQARRPAMAAEEREIAVIGMSCRFPGADSVAEFWTNLRDGRESIARFTVEEMVAAGFDREMVSHPDYVRASPVLRDPKGFDAGFFGYAAREAELLDPQQRLFLHVAWEALEDAGYDPLRTPERIGAYVGAAMNTYFVNNVLPNRQKLDARDRIDVFTLDSMGGFQAMVANDKDYISTRVSYKLDLRGPSINVQTACSTGLVVVHLAVQSLLAGECDMALAGTSSVLAPLANGHLWQDGMLVSRDGHCKAFDADASGTIFGSGVGAVLLKPLSRALADGDHVYAVIKGTAVNNDGGVKVGYMAPSGAGETAVVRDALAAADVPPETITLLEAHGTGTALGDPIEVASLAAALNSPATPRNACALGSVKTNVGHLQISSGIVGFMKAVLALHHRQIPPTLHFRQPNPGIDLAGSPFYINTETKPWATAGFPRRAGVNSLGIGGSNAHVILEEAPQPAPLPEDGGDRPWHVLTLSARTEAALERLTAAYLRLLDEDPAVRPADVAFTANTGRKTFEHRRAVVFDSLKTLRDRLPVAPAGRAAPAVRPVLVVTPRPVAAGLAADLVATAPVFRQTLADCDAALAGRAFPPLADALGGLVPWPSDPAFAAVAAAATQVALGRLWLSWGLTPAAIAGDARLAAALADTLPLAALLADPPPLGASGDGDLPAEASGPLVPVLPEGATGDLWPALLEALARLHVAGAAVDWAAFDAPHARRRVSLPTYPFEARPYWLEPPARAAAAPLGDTAEDVATAPHPLIDRSFVSPLLPERLYEADFTVARRPILSDHLIDDEVVVSGACHLSMVLGAAGAAPGTEIADVAFLSALRVPAEGARVQLLLRPREDGKAGFTLATTRPDGQAEVHATGFVASTAAAAAAPPPRLDPSALAAACPHPVDLAEHDRVLAARRIHLGPQYRWMTALSLGDGQALCRLEVPDDLTEAEVSSYGLHPGLIDACFGLMIAATAATVEVTDTFVPSGLDRLRLHAPAAGRRLWAWGRFETAADRRSSTGTIHLIAEDGTPVMTIEGLVGRAAGWERLRRHAPQPAVDGGSLLQTAWLAAPAATAEAPAAAVLWLVLGEAPGLATALAAAGAEYLTAAPADRAGHASAVADALARRAGRPLAVVDVRGDAATALLAAQAVAAHEAEAPALQLLLVTRHAVAADDGDAAGTLDAAGAGVWGIGKVVRLEHPGLACRTIDRDDSTPAAGLLTELLGGRQAPAEVALRAGRRLLPRLTPLPPTPAAPPALRAGATYVLTGASGALGSIMLDWLAEAGARTIVAVSRSGGVDETAAARLAAAGVTLHPVAADVAESLALPADLPPVRGIVHAAGTLADATLATATAAQLAAVVRPKLAGARALAALAEPGTLDFLVLFSSAASVIGNAGQAAYAAANAMLDTLAADLRRQGVPATAVSWGPWAGDGMAARSAHATAGFARLGLHGFMAEDGLRHLNAALTTGLPHVCALRCDWGTYLAQTHQTGDDPRAAFFAAVAPAATPETTERPPQGGSLAARIAAAATPEDRRSLLYGFVLQQVTDALSFTGVAAIDPHEPLMEQGLDSLAAVGLRAAINEALERTFPVGMFFEHPTLEALADYLHAALAPATAAEAASDAGPAPGLAAVKEDEDGIDLDDLDLAELEALVKQELDA